MLAGTLAMKVEVLATQSCPSLLPCGLEPTRLLCPGDSPGKNPGVGCRFLLQGMFLTQGSNPCFLVYPALQPGILQH